jgi:hypothetical protein
MNNKEYPNKNKKENWKEVCTDCHVLQIDMDCRGGCEILEGSFKKALKKQRKTSSGSRSRLDLNGSQKCPH